MLTFDNSQKITVYYISSLSRLKTIHVPSAFSLLNKFGSNVCRFPEWKLECPKDSPARLYFATLFLFPIYFLTLYRKHSGKSTTSPVYAYCGKWGIVRVSPTKEEKCRGTIVTNKSICIQSIKIKAVRCL